MTEQDTKYDFVRSIVADDLASGKHDSIVTRFPPEPNGFLHIGHAKAICVDFGIPNEFGGKCHLRFDDTNPSKEEQKYVDAIKEDILWLGFDWGENLFYASDNFEQLFTWAVHLIENGDAYVDEQSPDEMRAGRGSLTEAGTNSPFRDRPTAESLALFHKMRAGEAAEGEMILRAKIDMASPNINLRDPAIYRIQHQSHPRTGDKWCVYPMYDFAHGQSDAIEGITHSLCTMEFENHRPLYEWLLEHLPVKSTPRQIEFARLNISYTLTSKRKLKTIVDNDFVDGWDDPRMPTISGMRRRGYPAAALRAFCDLIGIKKTEGTVDFALLQSILRDHLNDSAERRMAVQKPLKVVITNWPEGHVEMVNAKNHPGDEAMGTREVAFSGELYIERDDFKEEAPRKYFRLKPGAEVRFKYAYYLTCTDFIKDEGGEVVEVHCTYDPETKGGDSADKRKVKGTIHWVSAAHAVDAKVRLYDHLFNQANPEEGGDYLANINPDSCEIITAKVEPALAEMFDDAVQFERAGYFVHDTTSTPDNLVFNRTVAMRDSWAKLEQKLQS
ncbi:MAG: glutamine--tRNA ligase/YqeY domain fusion protein [Planctomycetota bacterium]|nr:glutamine--tRNA ligase/YqeY domain fusion protein [Planctomycetota bacterium]